MASENITISDANSSGLMNYSLAVLNALPQLSTAPLNILMATLSALAICLNVLLMVRIRMAWKSGSSTGSAMCISNLSIADFLIAASVPLRIQDLTNQVAWTSSTCDLYIFLRYFSVYLAVNTKVVLSVESYCALFHPIRFRALSGKRCMFILLFCLWILCALETIVPIKLAVYARLPVADGDTYYLCSPFGAMESVIYINITFLGIPLLIVVILYGRILAKIFRDKQAFGQGKRSEIRKKRMAKIILIIIAIFFCCWTPASIMQLQYLLDKDSFFSSEWFSVFQVFGALIFFHPVVNPIIFLTTNRSLRFSKLCFKGREDSETIGQTTVSPGVIRVSPASISQRIDAVSCKT